MQLFVPAAGGEAVHAFPVDDIGLRDAAEAAGGLRLWFGVWGLGFGVLHLSGYVLPSSVVILSMSCGAVPASTTFSREWERKGRGAPLGRSIQRDFAWGEEEEEEGVVGGCRG